MRDKHWKVIEILEKWAAIGSVDEMIAAAEEAFSVLGGEMRRIPLPPYSRMSLSGEMKTVEVGSALAIRKRPEAPIQVFLGGHLDTVLHFPVTRLDRNTLQGPGVADMRGGVLVMLKALQAFETSNPTHVGWEVLLTPDEEVGSPSSSKLIEEIGSRCHVGLVFESSPPEGFLVSKRPASLTMTIVAKGEAAHSGKAKGKSAIAALAQLITRLEGINVGKVMGGRAANVVADHAACRINKRGDGERDEIERAAKEVEKQTGVTIELYEDTYRPPKPFDERTEKLFEAVRACGKELGQEIDWRESGGVCDGNNLAAVGLPTVDALGVRGGNLHTEQEYMLVESLAERAALTALLLSRIETGEVELP